MAGKKYRRIIVRVSPPLRDELERVSAETANTLSETVRKALIDFAARRFIEREQRAAV
jgi:hypothetical protein